MELEGGKKLQKSFNKVCAFGNRDDFTTAELAAWLLKAGGVAPKVVAQSGPPEHLRSAVRNSRLNRRDSDDEDSDFSE